MPTEPMRCGPNERCPCGSGLKFKRCHGKPTASATHDPHGDRAGAIDKLVRLGMRHQFAASRAVAEAAFWPAPAAFDPAALQEVRRSQTATVNFWSWFGLDHRDPDGRRVVDACLKTVALSHNERAWLEASSQAAVELFDIDEVIPDEALVLHRIRDGAVVRLRERALTHHVQPFQILGTRAVRTPDGLVLSSGDAYLFDVWHRPRLLGWNGSVPDLNAHWLELTVFAPTPTYVTAEGDEVAECATEFGVRNADQLVQALAGASDFVCLSPNEWDWVQPRPGSAPRILGRLTLHGDKLELFTHSRPREARGRMRLLDLASDGLEFLGETVRPPAWGAAARRVRGREAGAGVSSGLEAAALAQRARSWPDMPIPALGGQTPRVAVVSDPLAVVRLLKSFEHSQAARGMDLRWLWAELGLDRLTFRDVVPEPPSTTLTVDVNTISVRSPSGGGHGRRGRG